MISLGSRDEVVFILHVNLSDLGLTSPLSPPPTLDTPVDLPPGVPLPGMFKEPSYPVSVPSYRLLNFELSLEKKETRLAECNAEVS